MKKESFSGLRNSVLINFSRIIFFIELPKGLIDKSA